MYRANVLGEESNIHLMSFDDDDRREWKVLFDTWKKLNTRIRKYGTRGVNFHESLSEVAFCLYSGSKRFVKINGKVSASFDTFNLKTNKAEQIKATSVDSDLTSFGPTSQWDDLYFLDFYNKGKLDGTFNAYKIKTKTIQGTYVNKTQTFIDQQKQGRRPRFSIIDDIIKAYNLEPEARDIKVWL